MATPPSATPGPTKGSGPGCLIALVLLPVVVIAGLVIGAALNQADDPNDERSVTVDEGTIGGTEWRVDAVRDVEGDTCAFLYEDDEQTSGGCALTPEYRTIGDHTVVFGRATTDAVRVVLDTDEVVEIDTTTVDGIDGRFYVEVVAGDVDAESLEL